MAAYFLLLPMRAKSLPTLVLMLAASWPLSCRVLPPPFAARLLRDRIYHFSGFVVFYG